MKFSAISISEGMVLTGNSSLKLDMGKSCTRFKNPDKIPIELIGELCSKMSVKTWIKL